VKHGTFLLNGFNYIIMKKLALYFALFLAFSIGYVLINKLLLGKDFNLNSAIFVGVTTGLVLVFVAWIPLIKNREAKKLQGDTK